MKPRMWAELSEFVRCCHVGVDPGDVIEFHIEGTFWREADARQAVADLQQFRGELHKLEGLELAERDKRIAYTVIPVWKKGRNLGFWWLRLLLRGLEGNEPTPKQSHLIQLKPFEKRA